MITNVRFASLYVRDQQKQLEFWADKLGCEVLLNAEYSEDDPSQRWIEVRPGKGETYLVISPTSPEEESRIGGFSNIWFDCDDLEATYEDLKGKGVEFPVPPSDAPWAPGTKWAQFADPDGNLYGLSQR